MKPDTERVFDIFRKTADGNCVWVEAVKGFEEARMRVHRLEHVDSRVRSEYKIFDPHSGRFLEKVKEKTA